MRTQNTIKERAFAKINICLDVLGRMEDGYHAVKTVMQSVIFGDSVTIIPMEEGGYNAKTNLRYLPTGERNIAVQAIQLFRAETGKGPKHGVIGIRKRIPVCGGLGGGSTDGAAVIRALNREYKAGLTRQEMEEMGAKLGADVPFCIAGGTALAEGRGDKLTPITPLPDCPIVICKPEFSSSTPELFAAIDKMKIRARPDTQGLIEAIGAGDLKETARRMFNVFEYALTKNQAHEIGEIKGRLLDLGALGAAMSGSGSAVYGIYDDPETAMKAVRVIKGEGGAAFLTKTSGAVI